MYRLNTENGDFTPDKSPKSPYLTDLKHDQGGFVKEIEYIYLVDVCVIIYIVPRAIYIIPHTYV